MGLDGTVHGCQWWNGLMLVVHFHSQHIAPAATHIGTAQTVTAHGGHMENPQPLGSAKGVSRLRTGAEHAATNLAGVAVAQVSVVHVVADGLPAENIEGVDVISLPRLKTGPTDLPQRVRRVVAALRWMAQSEATILHVHDPELLPAALVLRMMGRIVVYDIHDDYRASILTRLRSRRRLARMTAAAWDPLERLAAQLMSSVTVADRHLAERFTAAKPTVLGNYPSRSFYPYPASWKRQPHETFNLLYVGGVSTARGVGVALSALDKLTTPNARLHIVGTGREPQLDEALSRHPQVVIHGRVPWRELHRLYAIADVGLALYQRLPGFEYYTGENVVKINEYMAAGLPVVTADFPGLRTYVADAGTGIVVDCEDAAAVTRAIETLYADSKLRAELGTRGRQMFEQRYNWERESIKLLELYHRISGLKKGRFTQSAGPPDVSALDAKRHSTCESRSSCRQEPIR